MTDHTYAGYTAAQIRAAAESGLWSQFINVARPETVLTLLDRIAELEADNSEYEAFVNECRFMSPGDDVPLHGLADRMRADKRALRIDAERYRWIRDKERFHIDGECGDATFSSCMCYAEEFDDAIDAARAQQKNPAAP